MNKLSRRDFLKGTAASALGLAATTVLGGCATNETTTECEPCEAVASTNWLGVEPTVAESDITETWETDVVIVGAGNGGLMAGAYAAKLGLNFRVIEQGPVVGDTRHWYGVVNSKYAKEAGVNIDTNRLKREVTRYANGKNSMRVLNTWVYESAAMSDFVDEIYATYAPDAKATYTHGEEAFWPEGTRDGYYFPEIEVTWSRNCDARNVLLAKYMSDNGHEIDFKTEVIKLEKDSTGAVVAVIAKQSNNYIRIKTKNVILATGGYPGNPEMMQQLDPLGTSVTTACSYAPQDKGMGIKVACWAGAQLQAEPAPMLFDRGIVAPGVNAGYDESNQFPGTVRQFNLGTQPFMKINRNGVRFTNESCPYNDMVYAASNQPGHVYASIIDSSWKEDAVRFHTIGCSAQTRNNPDGVEAQLQEHIGNGIAFQADTLDELADKLGLSAEAKTNFLAEVEKYNGFYDAGEDKDFGKPALRLSQLRTAPFYGFWLGASLLTTEQGIMINENGQALDTTDTVIPGLYVVGDCSGGMFSNNYPCLMPGIACGRTLTYGVKAVKTIAGIE